MAGGYVTEVSVLMDVLKELRAIRKLLENQNSGDVGQVKAGGTEYHFNGFSAEDTAEILNEIKGSRA